MSDQLHAVVPDRIWLQIAQAIDNFNHTWSDHPIDEDDVENVEYVLADGTPFHILIDALEEKQQKILELEAEVERLRRRGS